MAKKFYSGYDISQGYRKVTIWTFEVKHNGLNKVSNLWPSKKLKRKEKYKSICKHLKEYNLKCPEYNPTKKEESLNDICIL